MDDNFLTIIQHLQASADNAADASLNAELRQWEVPTGITSVLDSESIGTALSRDSVGDQYGSALFNGGSSGDAASLKLQSDYLAVYERSFRARHLTPVRANLHAAARRKAHGVATNGMFARVATYAQDLILAGGAKSA